MTAPDTLPPELEELGALLREDPPRPTPTWAKELDARAAAGFPRPPRRSPWSRLKPRREWFLPAAGLAATAAVAVIVVIGVSSPGDVGEGGGGGASSSAGGGESATSGASGDRSLNESSSEDSAGSTRLAPRMSPPAAGGGSPGSDSRTQRKQERSASMTLTAEPDEVEDVGDGVVRVTDNVGGFVSSSTVSGGEGGSFELRIPTNRLQKALADLSALAHVSNRTQASRDITAESVSARDRLREHRSERTGLLKQLAAATTTNETESIKARLRTVNAQIASARASVRRVDNRAAYANVSVSLVADSGGSAAADDGRWTPADAFDDALRVLEVAAGIAMLALAIALPFAILVALMVVAVRLTARRRRERALDAA